MESQNTSATRYSEAITPNIEHHIVRGEPQVCGECGRPWDPDQIADYCDRCGAPRCLECKTLAGDNFTDGAYICSTCAADTSAL